VDFEEISWTMNGGEPYTEVPTHVAPRLPPEVIDRIIDYLHDSPADLRTSALVCKPWLASSRFHLFSSVSIDPWHFYSFCCNLYAAIQQSPHIALLVRELHCSYEAKPTRALGAQDWPSKTGTILPLLLRSFTALCKLRIANVSWLSFAPDIRKSFRDILALPSLVHFEAVKVNFPKLEHFTSLLRPHLTLGLFVTFSRYYDYSGEEEEDGIICDIIREIDLEIEREAETERGPCRIESLTLSSLSEGSDFVHWLLDSQSVVDLSNVHTFKCDLAEFSRDRMVRLMRAAGSSIERLAVEFLRADLCRAPSSSLPCYFSFTDFFFGPWQFSTTLAWNTIRTSESYLWRSNCTATRRGISHIYSPLSQRSIYNGFFSISCALGCSSMYPT
jgi:hypothetical protein